MINNDNHNNIANNKIKAQHGTTRMDHGSQ